MNSRRIAVFVGTRADLWPMAPVIAALAREPAVSLHVLCGLDPELIGLTRDLVGDDGEVRLHDLSASLDLSSGTASARRGQSLGADTLDVLTRLGPESLVVLGDRWELLYVVPPAFLLGVRIVHIHGGEVTEGALDERVRHAVSKLSDVHCVASEDAASRLLRMGEPEDRVLVTGAPGLDRIRDSVAMDAREFEAATGAELRRPVVMLTYHPVTMATPDAPDPRSILSACVEAAHNRGGVVVATHPGLDVGRDEIVDELVRLGEVYPRLRVFPSLGPRYAATLATCNLVLGNSSSGIIEAGTLGLPVVDVGDRQRGRVRGANVLHAKDDPQSIVAAVGQALSPGHVELSRTSVNPYGDGRSAPRIAAATLAAGGRDRRKPFGVRANRPPST